MIIKSPLYQDQVSLVLFASALCIIYLIINFIYLRKNRLKASTILTLPSTLIPTLIFVGYCSSIIWSLFDDKFKITYLRVDYLKEASLLIFGFASTVLIGILIGRNSVINRFKKSFFNRKLDKILRGENGYYSTIFLLILTILVFPFCFGLEIDRIFQGGIRGLSVSNKLLSALIPFARILLSLFTVIAGILRAYGNTNLLFIVPILELVQHLMKLSRGFFIPIILFLFSYNLSGKKIPVWMYFSVLFTGVIAGSGAIAARGSGGQGISGIFGGLSEVNADGLQGVRDFFQANAVIGIISTAVSLRSKYGTEPIDGFLKWLQSMLPIPSFLGLSGNHLSVAKLLNITHAGIPMPALGELYFYMGWWSLIIFLLYGIFLGKIEGQLIAHITIHKLSYWPHLLIWLSMLFGFILSMHSPSRSSTRLLMYSILFVATVKFFINFNDKKELKTKK
jgi:hypothetical protein